MTGTKRSICGVLGFVLAAAVAASAMTATEAIKQRQEAMEGVLDGMKTLGAIAKKEQPFEAEVVKASATKVADHLKQSAGLFPDGSDTGDVQTWAKPEIWTDRARFDELFQSAHQAAIEMQAVTEADAFAPALGKLGNACKSCHDAYRLPKQ